MGHLIGFIRINVTFFEHSIKMPECQRDDKKVKNKARWFMSYNDIMEKLGTFI